jgi:type I restriction enzyme, S subunit
MDVRPGYKQTEVGNIPEDWEVKRLGELGKPVRGASPRPAGDPRFFNGSFIPWLTVGSLTNIPTHQLYVTETTTSLTEQGAKLSRTLQDGTLVIVNSGARTLGVAKLLALSCCANDGIAALVSQSAGEKRFLCYFLNSQIQRLRQVIAAGNDQLNLNTGRIALIAVPFPEESEQRAIAEALSDVDALLSGLTRLIAKKRDLRTGAMQRLLTGQTRLPGFNGEWELLNMAQKSVLKARIGWQGLTTAEYLSTGTYHLVTGTDFSSGRINWATCPFVTADRYEQDRNIQLRRNDVLVTKDGTIGKVAFVDELPGPATLNSGVFAIRPKGNAYQPKFLYYILSSVIFEDFLRKLAAGSTISHLYQKDFVSFEFPAPPSVEEQTSIAAVLSDLDAEIAVLEARLEKTRELKQGMMQALLTGRVRLTVPAKETREPEAAHA